MHCFEISDNGKNIRLDQHGYWVPGFQAIGTGLLVCTMIGAVLSHILILGPSAVPAIILGVLAGAILYQNRAQLTR